MPSSAGDYLFYKNNYSDKSADVTILAATDDQGDIVAVKSASHQIFIQKIVCSITTYSAVTWTFKDDAATPVIVAVLSIPAAQATAFGDEGTVSWDFGPKGLPLTVGKNLDLDVSAAGAAGRIHIEAYEKLGATISYLAGASLQ